MPELLWKGKYRDGVRTEPSRAGADLRTEEIYGSPSAAWHDRLILGDSSRILPTLARDLGGKVALAYVDPPFDTGGTFNFRATIPDAAADASRIELPAYEDRRGLDAWLSWFYASAVLLRDLLCEGGSLYVHLDAHAAHYAKVVLDEVFGPGAFQREIIWRIGWVSGFKSRARAWIRNHDTLLFYAKGGRPRTFHKEYAPYPPGYARRDGSPPKAAGYPIDDVWNANELDRMDSIQIVSFSGEKVGYPTQKNESLVARIVRASSSPGDLVLDCCVGSGTTAVVAAKLKRRWIACDQAPIAIHATRKRLLSLRAFGPFVVEREQGASGVAGEKARKLSVSTSVERRRATIELAGLRLPSVGLSRAVRASVKHWSQWIEGWCVDWDHRGGAVQAGTSCWRSVRRARLPLEASHTYERPGRYEVAVKVFDVLGGSTTTSVRIDIKDGRSR